MYSGELQMVWILVAAAFQLCANIFVLFWSVFEFLKYLNVFVLILKCICPNFHWLAQWRVANGLDFGCRCFPTSQQQSYSWWRCILTHGDIVFSFSEFWKQTPKKCPFLIPCFLFTYQWHLIPDYVQLWKPPNTQLNVEI